MPPPLFSELSEEERQRLTALFEGNQNAATEAFDRWRLRKINFRDTFLTHADAFATVLDELSRKAKEARIRLAAIVPEVPGWHQFLTDRARGMGLDPNTIPSRWDDLNETNKQIVYGQRERARLFVDGGGMRNGDKTYDHAAHV